MPDTPVRTVYAVWTHYGEMSSSDALVPFHSTVEGATQAALEWLHEFEVDLDEGDTIEWQPLDRSQWPNHIAVEDTANCRLVRGWCDENAEYDGTACWVLEIEVGS